MSNPFLVPSDPVTRKVLIELLAKMILHEQKIKYAAATAEFPRPDVTTADIESAKTDIEADATIVTVLSQNDDTKNVLPENSVCRKEIA